MKKFSNKIIQDYEFKKPLYESFTKKMESLVRDLLRESNIAVHSVSSRTKDKNKLHNKINREDKNYKNLEEITDLSGIRIICLILDEIKIVSKIIEDNFEVLTEFSVDKNKVMDADRFGYLSIHYVVRLSQDRARLLEYQHYTGLICEIQIRSILQHTWAEIQHDLGYKSKIEIPQNLERKFYMLAGLLELADGEFSNLKDEVKKYTKEVGEKIKKGEENILIDKITLESYLNSSEAVREINSVIIKILGAQNLINTKIGESYFEILKFFQVDSIKKLDELLKDNQKGIIKFAEEWITTTKDESRPHATISKAIAIFYLGYFLVAKTENRDMIQKYINIFHFPDDIIDRILTTYKSSQLNSSDRDASAREPKTA